MKVLSPLIEYFHLDPAYALLSIQNLMTAMQVFHLLDLHGSKCLNDIMFDYYMKQTTDLESDEIRVVFRLLDTDGSGTMEFDEFYLLFCVMVACKDQYEKEFIYRHSNSIFRLIDADNSGHVSSGEFARMGTLFNFDKRSVMSIFNEFDISGDKNLDFGEFRLFTMACIDEQRTFDAQKKVAAYREYNRRLVHNLAPYLRRYIRTRHLPPPVEIEALVESTRPPFMTHYHYHGLSKVFHKLKCWIVKFFRCIFPCCKKPQKHQHKPEHAQLEVKNSAKKSKCSCCCRNSKCCRRKVSAVNTSVEINDNINSRKNLKTRYPSFKPSRSHTGVQFTFQHFDR